MHKAFHQGLTLLALHPVGYSAFRKLHTQADVSAAKAICSSMGLADFTAILRP
jgi:hypothetical protein